MAAVINLKDLLAGQERLKQQEAQRNTTETMSVQEFRALQKGQTEGIDNIEKAVASTTGSGLNSNVVRLANEIKKVVSPQIQTRMKVQGNMFVPGATERIKDIAEQPHHEKFGSSFMKSLKGMGSLEGWFDPSGSGAIAKMINRRSAKREFIETNQSLTGESKKTLAKRFEKVNQLRGEAASLEQQRKKLEAQGFTPEQIERTGLNKKVAKLDQSISIADPAYRERRSADAEVAKEYSKPSVTRDVTDSFVAATGPSLSATPLASIQSSVSGLVGASSNEEVQAETSRVIGEQTQTLSKIEENTRGLAEGLATIGAASVAAATKPVEKESGGIISDIASSLPLGGRGARRAAKPGRFAKVGSIAKGFGIGAVAGLAGEGLQMGGNALREAGYEETGKAVNVAGSTAEYAGYGAMIGSVIPGVGTAIGAGVGGLIGAGKGVYQQYFGNRATPIQKAGVTSHMSPIVVGYQQEVSAGKLTNDQALSAVKQLSRDPQTIAQAEKVFGGQASNKPEIVAGASMAGAGVKQQMGLTQAGVERARPITPLPTEAESVYGQSAANKAAEQQPTVVSAPTIVNAPSTNVQQTTNNTVRNPARNSESSLQWYNRSRFA